MDTDFKKNVTKLLKEHDRASVLIAAATIENQLRLICQARLHPSPAGTEKLFEGYGPIATFSSRTLLAYHLGCINKTTLNCIDLIRKTRNHMAHEIEEDSLSKPPHSHRVNEITRLLNEDGQTPDRIFSFVKKNSSAALSKGDISEEKIYFVICCTILIWTLKELHKSIQRIQVIDYSFNITLKEDN